MVEQVVAATTDERVDRLGMFASTACAWHCAVCALVPAAFATLGLDILLDEKFEWLLTIVAVTFGVVTMVMGWRRHRNLRVMVILSVGIVGLLAVRFAAGHGHHEEHSDHATHAGHVDGDHHADHDGKDHGVKHAGNDHPAQHAGEVHHDKRGDHEHHKGHHEAEEHHDEHEHGSGEVLGIVAGFILLMGHFSNLQEMRRRRDPEHSGDECCDESIDADA